MVASCCAYNCTERKHAGNGISFHRFPTKDEMIFKAWCVAIRRKDFNPNHGTRICSKHFTPDCFQTGLKRSVLKPTAVPTIFNFGLKHKRHILRKKSINERKPFNRLPSHLLEKYTNTSTKEDTTNEKLQTVEIITIKREDISESEENETVYSAEQLNEFKGSLEDPTDNSKPFELSENIDFSSKEEEIIKTENVVLHKTVDDLNTKLERCRCLVDDLRSCKLIDKEVHELLIGTLEQKDYIR